MRVEPLRALLKMRRATTQAAKIALAHSIAAETKAHAQVAGADSRIIEESDAALSLGADDGAVEAYARWLPEGRRQATQARAVLGRASQEVSLARTALIMAKAAEHAITVELDRAERQIASLEAKRVQSDLDEIGARLSSRARPPSGR